MDINRLLEIFGGKSARPEDEEEEAAAEQANWSPEDYVCPMPTPAEEAAMFDAMRAERARLKAMAFAEKPPTDFEGEQAEADEWYQAFRRDRRRRRDLAPEAYREYSLDETSASDALRARLAELGGASAPSCVYAGQVSRQQAKAASKYGRFSVYADRRARHIAEIFTDDELDGLDYDGKDLPVFDREGRRYDFEFTYSDEHGFYRLTGVGGEYERFMVGNNVVRDVVDLGKKMTMQIFAFRSPKLLPEGEGFCDHPDGALGMIVLFSESEDEYADYIELDDDSMTVKEMVEHIQQNQMIID